MDDMWHEEIDENRLIAIGMTAFKWSDMKIDDISASYIEVLERKYGTVWELK